MLEYKVRIVVLDGYILYKLVWMLFLKSLNGGESAASGKKLHYYSPYIIGVQGEPHETEADCFR